MPLQEVLLSDRLRSHLLSLLVARFVFYLLTMLLGGEILRVVFLLLDGPDLAACITVSKHWSEIARDDYYWKCLCAKKWPSVCKLPSPPSESYYKLFKSFYKREKRRTLLPPRLSFSKLDFLVDVWADESLIFSDVIPGLVFRENGLIPPNRICDALKDHLEGPEYKMTLPVEPRFTVSANKNITVSVLAMRKDSNKVACLINKSTFDYIDRTTFRALAYDYLEFSPAHPFVSGFRVWFSLLFMDSGNGVIDVFGIEVDFCHSVTSEEEALWLLDMLDWK